MLDNIPDITSKLKDKDVTLIEESLMFIKGGFPTSESDGVGFRNKSVSLQERLSHLKNGLLFLLNSKRLRVSELEAELGSDNYYKEYRNREDRKNQYILDSDEYKDLNLIVSEIEGLYNYVNDLFWIIKTMFSKY